MFHDYFLAFWRNFYARVKPVIFISIPCSFRKNKLHVILSAFVNCPDIILGALFTFIKTSVPHLGVFIKLIQRLLNATFKTLLHTLKWKRVNFTFTHHFGYLHIPGIHFLILLGGLDLCLHVIAQTVEHVLVPVVIR